MTAKEDEAILKRHEEMMNVYEVDAIDTRTLKPVRIPREWLKAQKKETDGDKPS